MNNLIDNIIKIFNEAGRVFCDYSLSMFVQVSVLIVLLFIIDILIRKRVRATFRYCIWMLIFVKLVLPPALSLPTGIGNWFGEYFVVSSADFARQSQAHDALIFLKRFEVGITFRWNESRLCAEVYIKDVTPPTALEVDNEYEVIFFFPIVLTGSAKPQFPQSWCYLFQDFSHRQVISFSLWRVRTLRSSRPVLRDSGRGRSRLTSLRESTGI